MKLATLEDAQKRILEVTDFSEKLGEVLTFLLKEVQVRSRPAIMARAVLRLLGPVKVGAPKISPNK